jgi:hypothetical protein
MQAHLRHTSLLSLENQLAGAVSPPEEEESRQASFASCMDCPALATTVALLPQPTTSPLLLQMARERPPLITARMTSLPWKDP